MTDGETLAPSFSFARRFEAAPEIAFRFHERPRARCPGATFTPSGAGLGAASQSSIDRIVSRAAGGTAPPPPGLDAHGRVKGGGLIMCALA